MRQAAAAVAIDADSDPRRRARQTGDHRPRAAGL